MSKKAIPKGVAVQLCGGIQREHHGKWYTWPFWQCRFCVKYASDDGIPGCLNADRENWRGCQLVNRRYARLSRQGNRGH